MRHVLVMLATNDPSNGNDTGCVSCVEIHIGSNLGSALRLECVRREPTCAVRCSLEKVSYVRIGRKTFPISVHRNWYGNWCWRAVWMCNDAAARMVNHLRAMDKFDVEEGWTALFDKWTTTEPYGPEDFGEPKSASTTQESEVTAKTHLSLRENAPQKSVGTSGGPTGPAIPKGQPGSCT